MICKQDNKECKDQRCAVIGDCRKWKISDTIPSRQTLPKEIQERINHDSKGWDYHRAYIAGATGEATRALPLLEATKKLIELKSTPLLTLNQLGDALEELEKQFNIYNKQ